MHKRAIGVILPFVGPSQMAFYAIHNLNNISYNTHDVDCIIFTENLDKGCVPSLHSIMDVSQIWNFNGLLISTNIDNTMMNIKSTNAAKKIFYIWDLEWLRNKKNFTENMKVYRNEQINLVTRSEDYADAVHNYCGIRPRVIENFNLMEMLKWI